MSRNATYTARSKNLLSEKEIAEIFSIAAR
jgi:hypothetical protein